MFVRVVPLSQPSSKGLLYDKCLCELSRYPQPSSRGLLYVKCLCELSRYHSPVCYMLNSCPVITGSRGYMLNVCVSCPVITAQWKSSVIC